MLCAGSFDILVELVCEDDEHLLDLIDESIRSVEGVKETETFIYLRLVKQTYAWGTR
ncbi:MAG: Lrp/AsnC ligand binding domain-containing protein [Acidimicrobiales bacterium]